MNETTEKNEKLERKVGISSSGALREREDIVKVYGAGRIEGGSLNKFVKTAGSCRIESDLECNGFKSSGSLSGLGSITSHGNVRSSGSFGIDGNLLSDYNAKFRGSARIGGNSILKGSIKSSGSFKVDGGLEGGENAKFSGSAKVGKETVIQGFLKTSGSFRGGDTVQAIQGMKTSGSANVDGSVLSQKSVTMIGSSKIGGDVVAEDVAIGYSKWWKVITLRPRRKLPYKISGSVVAKNDINIKDTEVRGDVKGRNVAIRRRSKVEGNIYFVDSIKIRRSAKIANAPVKIKAEEL